MKRRGFLTALAAVAVAPFVRLPKQWDWRTYGVITFHGAPIVEDHYEPARVKLYTHASNYGMGEEQLRQALARNYFDCTRKS